MTNRRTKAELIDIVRDTEARLSLNHAWTRTEMRRMRKVELVHALRVLVILAESSAHSEAGRRAADEWLATEPTQAAIVNMVWVLDDFDGITRAGLGMLARLREALRG